MMYNTCSSYSSIIAFRRTYFGFTDFSCNFNPNENCPSNYCSSCCSFPVNSSRLMLPMNLNPNLLYGLRQSTLIRKRVVLGFNDWDFYRSSIDDVGSCCCCVKKGGMVGRNCIEKCCVEKRKSWGVGRVLGRNVSNNVGKIRASKHERDFRCNALDDVEAMLSLLSEEGIEECVGIRGRGKNSPKDARVVKEQNGVMGKRMVAKDNVLAGSECLESKSSTKEDFWEKGRKRREERNSLSIDEGVRSRRRESCSSYYSVSNSGESDSEIESEVDVKEEIILEESLTSQRKDSRKSGGVVISEVTNDAVKSYTDEKDQQLISSRRDDVRVGSSMEWDWRKKSEKRLTDESSEVNRTMKESVKRQSKLSQVNENSSVMASSSKKQFNNLGNVSTLDVNSGRQLRTNAKQYDRLNECTKSSGLRQHSTTHLKFHEHSESQASELEQSISDVRSSGQLKSEIMMDNQASEIMSSRRQSTTNAQKVDNLSDCTKSSGRHEHPTAHVKVHEHSESRVSELEQSISGVSSSGQSKSRIVIDSQANEYLKSSQQNEQSLTNRQNVESISTTRKPVHGKGVMVLGGQSLQETGCGYCKTCGRSMQESKIETGIDQHTDISEISGRYIEKVDSDYLYGQSMVKKQNKSEMGIKKLEEMSTSVESPYDVKKSQELWGGRVIKETESGKLMQTEASPQIGSTSVCSDRYSDSEKRIVDGQTYSTSTLKSVKDLVQIHELDEESNSSQLTSCSISQSGVQQVGEVKVKSDLQLPVMSPSFQLTETKTSDSETGTEMELSQVDDKLMLTGYSHHLTEEEKFVKQDLSRASGSSGTEGLLDDMWDADDHSVEEVSDSGSLEGEITESVVDRKTGKSMLNVVAGLVRLRWGSSSETQKSPVKSDQQRSPKDSPSGETRFSENEHVEGIGGDGIKSDQITSSQEPTSSDQSLIMRTAFRGRREHWNNKKSISMPLEPASEQPLPRESAGTSQKKDRRKKEQRNMSQEPTSDQSLLLRTTNQSQRGDFKLMSLDDRLGPASVSQIGLVSGSVSIGANTDFKMAQQTSESSPLSLAGPSTRWLRRSDAIEEIEEFERIEEHKSSTSEQRGSSSQDVLVPSIPQLTRSDAFEETEDRGRNEELISSTGGLKDHSVDVTESRVPTSEEIDTEMTRTKLQRSKQVITDRFDEWEDAYRHENEQRKVDEQRGSSSQDVLVPSIPQLTKSDAFEEIEDGGRNEELISSTGGLKDHSVDVTESRVPTFEEIDTEMTRIKLQRSKQVITDRFDEWEDAYRRENEQRKVDEFFMKEALTEAIKGADSWEVPVGAVLVQNGKVIARGYNLVEELRDSTAHAEMICIREASNVLRTWRLSETTLYVTLEPCPMCAGAILQARIGTLVWGAPNKLLGADGSWIRLFPNGVEGEERSEVADKPPAPAHPFHPKMNIRRGVLGSECAQIMQQFFQLRRKNKKEQEKKSEDEEEGQPSCLPVPHKPTKLLRKMHDVFHIS